ncbi:MAG: AEC family transporter [Clostridia bacterium]|nr:AEC family transporter [Eubacteriales bacterium]MDD3867115.1 AEC family transporter [Eubacteriales bacterium]NCC48504.1 AEC family transporter [Clostridia bacterium]
MDIVLHILSRNILPLFFLILIGYVLDRAFNLDINALLKVNFYVFVPVFTFVNLYQTAIETDALLAMLVTALILLGNMAVSHLLARIRGYSRSMTSAFQNSVMFYNSGNIGIPIVTLVFSSGVFVVNGETPYLSLAVTIQIMVLVIQNITTNTLGFFNAGRASLHWRQAVLNVLKMPAIYMISLAFILKAIPYDFTRIPIWPALEYARGGLVPVALITLGTQLAKSRIHLRNRTVYLAVATRLLIGPLMALALIWLLRIDGIVAQVLLISAAVPSAVNSALIAVEYDNHPDFATQVVVVSTLASAFTLTGVIYLASMLFPV